MTETESQAEYLLSRGEGVVNKYAAGGVSSAVDEEATLVLNRIDSLFSQNTGDLTQEYVDLLNGMVDQLVEVREHTWTARTGSVVGAAFTGFGEGLGEGARNIYAAAAAVVGAANPKNFLPELDKYLKLVLVGIALIAAIVVAPRLLPRR